MKVKTNSWHYNVMAFYKWCRKGYDWTELLTYRIWAHEKGLTSARYEKGPKDFKHFKAFMTDTGTFQPVDFCTYWRNVILWPLLFVVWWTFWLTLTGFILSLMTFKAFGAGVGVAALGFAVVFAFVGCLALLDNWHTRRTLKRQDKPKEPGFLSNVNTALKNPEICTMMEYEKE